MVAESVRVRLKRELLRFLNEGEWSETPFSERERAKLAAWSQEQWEGAVLDLLGATQASALRDKIESEGLALPWEAQANEVSTS